MNMKKSGESDRCETTSARYSRRFPAIGQRVELDLEYMEPIDLFLYCRMQIDLSILTEEFT